MHPARAVMPPGAAAVTGRSTGEHGATRGELGWMHMETHGNTWKHMDYVPNASGGLPNASGGLPNASGGLPNASGALPNASGAFPNASGALLPDASGALPNASGARRNDAPGGPSSVTPLVAHQL